MKSIRLRNTHSGRVEDFKLYSPNERAEIYFKAAYNRIFKQQIKGCCEALSYASPNKIYQVFTLTNNKVRKYKEVYSVMFPEFMLFERQYTSNGYWFDLTEEGRNERIIALLLCAEMCKDGDLG